MQILIPHTVRTMLIIC